MEILYGGTFNPPTIAHYQIAHYILNHFKDSRITFLPTFNLYAKNGIVDAKHRISMLKLLVEKLGDNAYISDYEIKLEKYHGTFNTIQHFNNPYYLVGADNFVTLHTWLNYEELTKCKFIIIPRNKIDINEYINSRVELINNKNNYIYIKDFKEIDVSSSEFRLNKNFKMINNEVKNYIKKEGLYVK